MGCPPGNYFEYLLVNKGLTKSEFGYNYNLNKNIDFQVKAGTYFSFVKSLKSGISASFHFEEKDQIQLFNNLDIKVQSKNFGELEQLDKENFDQLPRHQADNFIIFGSKLEKKDFKRKRMKIDTIFIELNGKKILEFTKAK